MRFRTLKEWLCWQERLHPQDIELGLERIAPVWRRLHPEGIGCPVVTVAGTNGKGSSVAMLDAILRAAGYRTACYTSPHLWRYNERIRIDGAEASDDALCRAFEAVDAARDGVPLTYFEFGTLAALYLFAHARPDIVILEVGLGGRLDAVNVVDADVALLTSIGIDHTDWLGDTREQIGHEKAGVFRTGQAAICADLDPPASVVAHAMAIGADLWRAGRDFGYQRQADGWDWRGRRLRRPGLPLPALRGRVQLGNAAGVLAVLEALVDRLPVDQAAVREGLQHARLPGRFEVVSGPPTWIFDVSHNRDGLAVLHENLALHACNGRTLAVFSMLADKSLEESVRVLADDIDHWFVAGLDVARGLDGDTLARRLSTVVDDERITVCGTVADAARSAMANAREDERILVFGSFHTVAQARRACL